MTETNVTQAHKEIKLLKPLLFKVDGGLSVEALVLSLHVGETCEVIGVHKRQVNLKSERTEQCQTHILQQGHYLKFKLYKINVLNIKSSILMSLVGFCLILFLIKAAAVPPVVLKREAALKLCP